jgi:hypothetical protein
MLRVGLTIYLVFVLPAGPALCCCGWRQALVPPAPSSGQPAEPVGERPCCCSHHAPPADKSSRDAKAPAPQQHDGNCPTCPCKEQSESLALPAPADGDFAERSQSLPSMAADTLLSRGAVSQAFGEGSCPGRNAVDSRLLTSQELLHILQVLRC